MCPADRTECSTCIWVVNLNITITGTVGVQWLSGRVLDSRPKGRGFWPHRRHCVVSLSKNINPGLVLVQPRNTRPFITESLLMGCKESNKQTNITGTTNRIAMIIKLGTANSMHYQKCVVLCYYLPCCVSVSNFTSVS